MRFQDGYKRDMPLNQLTTTISVKIPEEEEPEVPTIPEIPEDKATPKKGCYHSIYVMIYLNK